MINPLALTKCLKALDHLISPRVHQLIKWELGSLVQKLVVLWRARVFSIPFSIHHIDCIL